MPRTVDMHWIEEWLAHNFRHYRHGDTVIVKFCRPIIKTPINPVMGYSDGDYLPIPGEARFEREIISLVLPMKELASASSPADLDRLVEMKLAEHDHEVMAKRVYQEKHPWTIEP